jgi:hypothetical protein
VDRANPLPPDPADIELAVEELEEVEGAASDSFPPSMTIGAALGALSLTFPLSIDSWRESKK